MIIRDVDKANQDKVPVHLFCIYSSCDRNNMKSLQRQIHLNVIRAKQSCRVRSTPIDNTYHLEGSFKCTLYPTNLKSSDNMVLCLHMLFPSIITEICNAQNGAGPLNRPVISSHESGLIFAQFAIKFFQLFSIVQRWQSGIALNEGYLNLQIYIIIKEKKNNLIEQTHILTSREKKNNLIEQPHILTSRDFLCLIPGITCPSLVLRT